MSPSKRIMLFGEFGEARKWYIKHGRTKEQADAMRGKLIAQALGEPKSMSGSAYWTDDEITKVKMAFKAVYDGGNFKAQMEGQENARKQAGIAEAELRNLLVELYPDKVDEDTRFHRENTMHKMIRRICKKQLHQCSAHDLKKVIGEFKQQKARNEKNAADAIAEAHAASEQTHEGNPF